MTSPIDFWAAARRLTIVVCISVILNFAASIAPFGCAAAQLDEAASLINQAVKLFNEGHYAASEPLFKRSLAILETTLGPEHFYLAGTLSYLARVYSQEGR